MLYWSRSNMCLQMRSVVLERRKQQPEEQTRMRYEQVSTRRSIAVQKPLSNSWYTRFPSLCYHLLFSAFGEENIAKRKDGVVQCVGLTERFCIFSVHGNKCCQQDPRSFATPEGKQLSVLGRFGRWKCGCHFHGKNSHGWKFLIERGSAKHISCRNYLSVDCLLN